MKRFIGSDMRDGLRQVKQELGGDAVIMSTKPVPGGIEIVAAYEKEPEPGTLVAPEPAIKMPAKAIRNRSDKKATPAPTSLSEIIGDAGPDSLRELLEKQVQQNSKEARVREKTSATTATTEPAQSIPSQASELADIKDELSHLRNVLQFQVAGLLEQQQHHRHPLQSYFREQLIQMGFEPTLAGQLVSYLDVKASEKEAWLFILKLIANRIQVDQHDLLSNGGVVALMGPTGTGKTTTIAKLAARFAQRYGADQLALITTDTYRIAAYEQLATYGKIIGCPVKKVATTEQLNDALHQFRQRRLVLIDTAGFSQRDTRLIKQLDTLKANQCATIKQYLVLQANAQRQVLTEVIDQYKQISLQGCIFTKLDECYSLGEIISTAINAELPLAFYAEGQRVPEDIRSADAKYLVSSAARLHKQYTHRLSNQANKVASGAV